MCPEIWKGMIDSTNYLAIGENGSVVTMKAPVNKWAMQGGQTLDKQLIKSSKKRAPDPLIEY